MTLITTSLLSLIATAVKVGAGIIINKAIAIYIGPSGLALIGQFQNFMQVAMTAAQGGINAGITKYTSEYRAKKQSTAPLFGTTIRITLSCSLVVGVCIAVFSRAASARLLGTEGYIYIFILFGLTLTFFALNQLLLSIINGLKEVNTYIKINISQSLVSLIFSTVLIIFFGLEGALLALVTNQSIVFLLIIWKIRKHPLLSLGDFSARFDKKQAKKLMAYSAMALTTAAIVPISHMLLRRYLGESLGWEQAGYWQAIWYISNTYLMVVTTALSIYYLPRLSELTSKKDIRRELFNGYKLILPLVSVLACLIFLLKDFIIAILFTADFLPMRKLFMWQLIGDVIKLAAWLLSYLMLAKALSRMYIVTEILFAASFVGFTIIFVDRFGLIGTTYAFALNYTIYFFTIAWLMRSYISTRANRADPDDQLI